MYFCVNNCTSPLYTSGMQQQQPGIVTHSHISSLMISGCLTRPRVALRYSVWTFTCLEVGVTTPTFLAALHVPVAEAPLSKFLNPPLISLVYTQFKQRSMRTIVLGSVIVNHYFV